MSALDDLLAEHTRWLESGGVEGNRADFRMAANAGTFVTEDFRHVGLPLPVPQARQSGTLTAEILERDLAGVDLSRAILDQVTLPGCRMEGAVLRGIEATRANFDGAKIAGADFTGANLASASFIGADLRNCRFDGAVLRGARFTNGDLTGAHLTHAVLTNADLRDSNLASADLSDANLDSAELSNAVAANVKLVRARVRHATGTGITLSNAELDQAEFSTSRFPGAKVAGARGAGVTWMLAVLDGSDFSGVRLPSSNFRGASLESVVFIDAQLTYADFREVAMITPMPPPAIDRVEQKPTVLRGVDWTGADLAHMRIDAAAREQLPPALVHAFRDRIDIEGGDGIVLKVFICHGKEDTAAALEIYERLAHAGFEPWIDKRNLRVGERWEEAIPVQIAASDAVVVCLSTSAMGRRGYVHNELRLALRELEDMPVPDTIFVLPVRIDACEVPRHLRGFHYVDYWEPGAIDRIIASLHTIQPMRRTSSD
ncbi:MAG TPA: toll/interleukin-1 receptor domain-containing protein [Thermoanaerobaculia bacterium]|nr:toll/interleukin-1 receptor domain-containing protein [Thermoanaerobaculia bacterium]